MVVGMIVENGVVSNVAMFDSESDIFDGWILCPDGVGIGFTDNGNGTFSAPQNGGA